MSFRFLSLLAILGACTSCAWTDHSPENGWYEENFDNLAHWKKEAVITSVQSHSGMFSTYADSTQPVSEQFTMHFNEVRFQGFTGVTASAWIFNPSEDTSGRVVLEIVDMRSGEPETVHSRSVVIGQDFRQVNSWGEIRTELPFPKVTGPHQVLRFYLQSIRGKRVFLDDVSLHFHRKVAGR
jgi:hypothetical protein